MDRKNTIDLINLYARTGGFDLEPLYPTRDSAKTYNEKMQNMIVLAVLTGTHELFR